MPDTFVFAIPQVSIGAVLDDVLSQSIFKGVARMGVRIARSIWTVSVLVSRERKVQEAGMLSC